MLCSTKNKSHTFTESPGKLDVCSDCGLIGWKTGEIPSPGRGPGYLCPACKQLTFHDFNADAITTIFRCSSCQYSGVRLSIKPN